MKYPNSETLKKNQDFQKVYQEGKSCANRYLVLYVRENGLTKNRIGISVSKKVGNSVVRHQITRLIRESYRLQEDMFNSGLDMVVIARVNAKGRSFEEIKNALLHLGKLQGVLTNTWKWYWSEWFNFIRNIYHRWKGQSVLITPVVPSMVWRLFRNTERWRVAFWQPGG